jgi:hypothetical protein
MRASPVTTLVVAFALPLLANAASHELQTFVGEYDLDRNGSVSKEEFHKERERRFLSTDTNHDGVLSRAEYVDEFRGRLMYSKPDPETVERQLAQTDVRFDSLDSNGNGEISLAEFYHSGWNMFGEHDYNRDDAVSLTDEQ